MSSGREYPERPIVGVGAVILVGPTSPVAGLPSIVPEPHGVVLVKRRFEPLAGHWSLPGGMLEIGETLEAGVAREMLEETGLVVAVGAVIEVFDRITRDQREQVQYHYVLVDYLCRPTGGTLRAGSDVSEVAIADPQAMDRFGMTPKVGAAVRRALEMAG